MDSTNDTPSRQALRACALPMLERSLDAARRLLAVAQAHATTPRQEQRLLASRLAPDMLCLSHQVRVLADSVAGACAQLAGDADDPDAGHVFNRGHDPSLGEPDTRLAEALARVETSLARLRALTPGTPLRAPGDTIVVARPGHARRFVVEDFVWRYVLPNAGFHAAMIHALLRAGGVPVGKADFEGPPVYAVVPHEEA